MGSDCIIIIDCSAGNGMGEKIGEVLHTKYAKLVYKEFPDGESMVRLPDIPFENEKVMFVQSTYNPQDRHILELLLAADEATKKGAGRVMALVPYLAYARQDKRHLAGDVVSIETILKLLNAVGISGLVVVQPHNVEKLGTFNGDVVIIEPIEALVAEFAKRHSQDKVFVLAPDDGSEALAKKAAAVLNCSYIYLNKVRDPNTGSLSVVDMPDINLAGYNVLIVDDMISTGGTVLEAAKFAYSKGAKSVAAAAVHLLMADGAWEKIGAAGITEVYGTNTVPCNEANIVDISDKVAEKIRAAYFNV